MNASAAKMAGFTLLPVMLTMSLLAAVAFLLNRDNGFGAEMVSGQMDSDRARLAAEAGLQAVNALVQSVGCGGGFPTVGSPVVNASFGGASYTSYATSAGGNTTGLMSTGTFNGTSVTLTRSNVYVYQSAPKTYTLQPDGTAGVDTLIDSTQEANAGNSGTLTLTGNTKSLLLRFDLSAFPPGSRPLGATLSIYGTGLALIGLELHRLRSTWTEGSGSSSPLDGATWNTSNGAATWPAGGDYHPVKVSSSGFILTSWSPFDITDLAEAWLAGQLPNHGLLIRVSSGGGTINYFSSENADATHRPKIVFSYLLPCGATGPQDPVSGTTTLSAVADGFDDSGATSTNNGAATTLKVTNSPTRENRILMRFDTSSVPAGAVVQSAALRLYVSGVTSATSNPKSLWVNAVSDAWVEGGGNNTNKNCPTVTAGSSWSYSTNCTGWSYVHPPNTAPSWSALANLPSARSYHSIVTVNNRIYVIGGYNGSSDLNLVEEYNPATNTWVTKKPMPTARRWATAAVVNNRIYVIGGEKAGTSQTVNEMYDPATDTWTTRAAMSTGRKSAASAVVGNRIYVLGGRTGSSALKTNQEYDPASNTWATKRDMPTARMWLAAQAVNGRIYAIGGWSGSASLNRNEEYNVSGNSWTTKANLPVAGDSQASTVLGSRIYLISGFQGSSPTKAVRTYDPTGDSYANQLDYPVATNEPAAVALAGRIHSLGGDDGGTPDLYANHYQYDPGIPVPLATAVNESNGDTPLASGFSSGWITFELKALVQEWIDGVRPNNGLVVTTDVSDQFGIASRESSNRTPQLVVSY